MACECSHVFSFYDCRCHENTLKPFTVELKQGRKGKRWIDPGTYRDESLSSECRPVLFRNLASTETQDKSVKAS
jgi:hypothetical protein